MNFLSRTAALATLFLVAGSAWATVDPIPVRVDPKVEFFAVMSRIAGYEEYSSPGFASYDAAVEAHFGPFRTHAAIATVAALRKEFGVGYNMPAELALALEPGTWGTRVPVGDGASGLDARWTKDAAARYLDAAREFWNASDAEAFFASQRKFHAEVEKSLSALLHGRVDIGWLRRQYGSELRRFTVIPGLLNGPHSYGPHLDLPGGTSEAFAILATPPHDAGQAPSYPAAQVASLLVHEMHHPYVNPWVTAHAGALEGHASRLFQAVEAKMKAAAYGRWDYMVNESLVRAQVLRYYRAKGDLGAYWRNLQDDRARGFAWVDALADRLDAASGIAGPFDARSEAAVITFFEQWADAPATMIAAEDARQAERIAQRRATGVQILRAVPDLEDARVAAGAGELRLLFDRAMSASVFIGGSVPDVTGKPRWNEANTELVIPVRFAAGTTYTLQLNEELSAGSGFVGKDGTWLIPREWHIRVAEGE